MSSEFDSVQGHLQQKLSFPNFHAINEETTEDEFDEIQTNFYSNSDFESDYELAEFFRSLSPMILNCTLYHKTIPQLLLYELYSSSYEIESILASEILYYSETYQELYSHQLITRAQFVEYLKILSDRQKEEYQKYCQSVKIFQWLLSETFDHLNLFLSEKLYEIFPNLSIDKSKINFSSSDIPDIQVSERIEKLKKTISESTEEDLDQYLLNDVLNNSISVLEDLIEFVRNLLKIAAGGTDIFKINLFRVDLTALCNRSCHYGILFLSLNRDLKLSGKYLWKGHPMKIAESICEISLSFKMDYNQGAFFESVSLVSEDTRKLLKDFQTYCKSIESDKVVKIKNLLKTLESFLHKI